LNGSLPSRFSRTQFLRRSVVAAGGVAALGMVDAAPGLAASDAAPRPIPGGFDASLNFVPIDPLIHVLPPAIGLEMATITDFVGVIAAGEMQGSAVGSDGSTYGFDCDMRFMDGHYVATDGRLREATFGFV
jgi:hypothetical protein